MNVIQKNINQISDFMKETCFMCEGLGYDPIDGDNCYICKGTELINEI